MSNHAVAVKVLKDEIKCLEGRIESIYDRQDAMRNQSLPQGAVWQVSEDSLNNELDEIETQVEALKASIEILNKTAE